MPKILTANNVSKVISLRFDVKEGLLFGASTDVEVNYGDRGMTEHIDLYPLLTHDEKQKLETIYNRIQAIVNKAILD